MHNVFAEPHNISTLDTSGRKISASALVRKKSDVPFGREMTRYGTFKHMI
jgi:hypothetical protein